MPNLNIEAKKANTYDAIVIGSGVSGGWAAKELTEKGLKVLMLERGKKLDHIADYANAMKAPWEKQYNGKLTTEQKERSPKLARDYPLQRNDRELLVPRSRFDVCGEEALRLVPTRYRRRKIHHVGSPVLPTQRHRLRGQRRGRHRDRLADPLQGH